MPNFKKAWLVAVEMGYGHERAAYPLKDIAFERVITANSDKIISNTEKQTWDAFRYTHTLFSRLKELPFVGRFLFGIFDNFQAISPLFPLRDLSRPTLGVFYFKWLIVKKGLCRSLIEYLKKEDIPLVTTHFIPALAAHYLGFKNIYCVVTDVDINRAWVPDKPEECRIKYLAPSRHTVIRLREYGIKDENIILTGFPLPKENIGEDLSILKRDLGDRLPNLDPKNVYVSKHKDIQESLNEHLKTKSSHPLTITYVVGGAGVGKDIGVKIAEGLASKIINRELILNLVAGTRLDIRQYFEDAIKKSRLKDILGSAVKIIYGLDKKSYFSSFSEVLHTTDILWTKPSELSFYAGLGLPVIIAPPVGAHERFNKEWLEHAGAGFVQGRPEHISDWLSYVLEDGRLAEAAWHGFMKAPVTGVYEIERIVLR